MEETLGLFASFGTWNWLIMGALLLCLEILLPGFYLFFFGASAILTGIIALNFPIPWQAQCGLFVAMSLINTIAARLFWNPHIKSDEPLLNKRGQQHIGKTYTLTTAIHNGRGKVKVGDTLWLVGGQDMPEGATVKVIGAQGSMLQVEQMTDNPE
ncbi:MAG: NfeD family protein [Pseudomonadota bacterium]